jgi:hypothetical protein
VETDGTAYIKDETLSVEATSLEVHATVCNQSNVFDGSQRDSWFFRWKKTGVTSNSIGFRKWDASYIDYFDDNGTTYGSYNQTGPNASNMCDTFRVSGGSYSTNFGFGAYIPISNSFDKFSIFAEFYPIPLRVYSIYGLEHSTGEMKFNFVPVVRKSDSVVGFYETVSKTFFTATTGTFTGGLT